MQDPDTSTPIDFTPSLIGNFIFDDELYFTQDEASVMVDGYLIATDMLVSRMEQVVEKKHSLDERETFDNINFYAIYNPVDHWIQVEGTYWYWNGNEETQGKFQLPLSSSEQEDLIDTLEAYCVKRTNRNCMDKKPLFNKIQNAVCKAACHAHTQGKTAEHADHAR